MEPVTATPHTLAPTVISLSLNVHTCFVEKIPDAHLPAEIKQNWNANAFPTTKAMANTASVSRV